MKVLDFEKFASMNGASRQSIGEAGLHRSSERKSAKTHRRQVAAQAREDYELIIKRGQLQLEYDRQVANEIIRPPTDKESLFETARGHPDLVATHAARRIAERRGWNWKDTI